MANANERNNYDIFISHAGPDKEQAMEICESLEAQGLRCWIAPRDVYTGNSYLEEIINGVSHSKSLLLLLSSNTENAEYVINEVERAKSYRRKIFTIRLEDVPIPKSIELVLSAPQWVDSWAIDYKERLQQIVQYSKQTDQPSSTYTQPTIATKFIRWARKNILAVATLSILVFFLLIFYSTWNTQPPRPEAFESIKEITQSDFNITTKLGKFSTPSSFRLQPVGTGILINPKMPYEQFYFNLEFDNQTSDRKLATFVDANFNIPVAAELPKSVTIVLEDKNGEKSEPMQFSLSGLTAEIEDDDKKATRALISKLTNSNNLTCYPFKSMYEGLRHCTLGSTGQTLKLSDIKKALTRISYGESKGELVNFIDFPNLKTTANFIFDVDESERFSFLVPMTKENIFYQLDMIDGQKSDIGTIQISNAERYAAFQAKSLNSNADTVFVAQDYNQLRPSLFVFPKQEYKQIYWQIYKGVKTEFVLKNSWFHALELPADQLADNDYNIELIFIDNADRETSFVYYLPLVKRKSNEQLISLKKEPSKTVNCDAYSCFFTWHYGGQNFIDLIDDIYIGYDADDLQSITTGKLDKIVKQSESKREKLISAEQTRLDGLEPRSSLSFGTPINVSTYPTLLERLNKPLVIDVNQTWKQRMNLQNSTIFKYSFAHSPLFMKLKYVDGSFSNVLVYRPELK